MTGMTCCSTNIRWEGISRMCADGLGELYQELPKDVVICDWQYYYPKMTGRSRIGQRHVSSSRRDRRWSAHGWTSGASKASAATPNKKNFSECSRLLGTGAGAPSAWKRFFSWLPMLHGIRTGHPEKMSFILDISTSI